MVYIGVDYNDADKVKEILKENKILIKGIWFDPLDVFCQNEAEFRIDDYVQNNKKELSDEEEKLLKEDLAQTLVDNNEYIINSDYISEMTNKLMSESGY